MKRIFLVFVLCLLLTGCGRSKADTGLQVREQLQSSKGCSFRTVITADYTDVLYEFELDCSADAMGNLTFEVIAPESIAGISGFIKEEAGAITFDDEVLAFDLMADDQITPISAPWILVNTLRSGFLRGSTDTDEGTVLLIDDSYEERAMRLQVWLNDENIPIASDIIWDGRRILSLIVSDFTYL